MWNKVPREFWGTGIIERDGKCLKIFTSRNAMTKEYIAKTSDSTLLSNDTTLPLKNVLDLKV